MTIDAALFAELKTVLPGTRIVAAGAGFALTADPYVAFERSSAEHLRHMTGGAGSVQYRYDVNIYSRTRSKVSALVDRIREAMDNRRGTIGAPAAPMDVDTIFLDSEDFLYEPARSGSSGGWHRALLGLTVWTAESKTPVT